MCPPHNDEPLFGGPDIELLPSVGLRQDVYRLWWLQQRVREFMSAWYEDHAPPPKDERVVEENHK